MSFVTYILFNSLLTGISGNFHPEQLAQTATTAFVIVFFELAILKMGSYLLNINGGEGQFLDLLGYSGYKFFGAILMILIGEVMGMNSWLAWAVFMYFFAANAFFLVRSPPSYLLPRAFLTGSTIATESEICATAVREWTRWTRCVYQYFFGRCAQGTEKEEEDLVFVFL